ncbi:SRPBCC domain-containing protein [Streptomyces cinnabarinus]|uniref:SRPBCC domain-containing protein n=1 Tax=Streptomyces cinnabarinus TaxID=67287 RepID=A0ABY7KK16_9ACTN|nr:SRPBCC domain-containing protein [Streptomyces cinnabarinus]WAZ23066.1 SRPBCC domain-containing protein [Streptomyces cinnabarinus]
MELEVFVPVATARLREALADPARVARALPGLQQDAGAETPMAGRLKVRVGGHTITYRGALTFSAREDGSYGLEGEATEARGTGSVKLSLTLRPRESDNGTTLTIDATATADGRITQLPPDQVHSAATRLLTRFAENLGTTAEQEQEQDQDQEPAQGQEQEPDQPEQPPATTPEPAAADGEEPPQGPPAPDDESGTGAAGGNRPAEGEAETAPEAAHARRTMIGRSAEEVDHAPPRGRYAPVPAPQPTPPVNTLRWAAPAAALAVASAIVVSRVLRRRR